MQHRRYIESHNNKVGMRRLQQTKKIFSLLLHHLLTQVEKYHYDTWYRPCQSCQETWFLILPPGSYILFSESRKFTLFSSSEEHLHNTKDSVYPTLITRCERQHNSSSIFKFHPWHNVEVDNMLCYVVGLGSFNRQDKKSNQEECSWHQICCR